MSCVHGGYKTMSPIQICNVVGTYNEGLVSFRAVRVFFACAAEVASREAHSRSSNGKSTKGSSRIPEYRPSDVARLIGSRSVKQVRAELRNLEGQGLLRFTRHAVTLTETPLPAATRLLEKTSAGRSSTRPIPIPRPVLRLLARPGAASTAKVILAHCLRGLSLRARTGEVSGRGTVKASWIAESFGMSLRAAKGGRAALVRLGLISRDTSSYQRKLNRDGAYFAWNLEWGREPVSALPNTKSDLVPAPPIEIPETPNGSRKHQKPKTAGVSTKPDIGNVVPLDLSDVRRLEELHVQAVKRRYIQDTEADAMNFAAAAVRARNARGGDSVRIFMGIVRRRLWKHITGSEEDQARAEISRLREEKPDAFRRASCATTRPPREIRRDFSWPQEPMSRDAIRNTILESLGLAA